MARTTQDIESVKTVAVITRQVLTPPEFIPGSAGAQKNPLAPPQEGILASIVANVVDAATSTRNPMPTVIKNQLVDTGALFANTVIDAVTKSPVEGLLTFGKGALDITSNVRAAGEAARDAMIARVAGTVKQPLIATREIETPSRPIPKLPKKFPDTPPPPGTGLEPPKTVSVIQPGGGIAKALAGAGAGFLVGGPIGAVVGGLAGMLMK